MLIWYDFIWLVFLIWGKNTSFIWQEPALCCEATGQQSHLFNKLSVDGTCFKPWFNLKHYLINWALFRFIIGRLLVMFLSFVFSDCIKGQNCCIRKSSGHPAQYDIWHIRCGDTVYGSERHYTGVLHEQPEGSHCCSRKVSDWIQLEQWGKNNLWKCFRHPVIVVKNYIYILLIIIPLCMADDLAKWLGYPPWKSR